jgi:DNA helicase-2/ATP-dependent DNA helicase PcrA
LIRENSIYVSQNFENPFEHVFSNGYFQKTQLPVGYGVSEKEMKKLSWEIYNNECVLVLKNRQKEDKILDYHNHLLKYKSFFWEKGILHYDDILAFAWEIIKTDANVLRILRAKFPYFFVDEFQDTNPIQTAILKKIAESETIVGVIGDSAQSIYSF